MNIQYSFTTPLSVQYKFVKMIQEMEKEDLKTLGKGIGIECKKKLNRRSSANEYSKFWVTATKRTFIALSKLLQLQRWIPTRKTNNCKTESHFKITSLSELQKLIPLEFFKRKVGENIFNNTKIFATIRCTQKWPFFITFDEKLDKVTGFFSYYSFFEKENRILQPQYCLNMGKRVSRLE